MLNNEKDLVYSNAKLVEIENILECYIDDSNELNCGIF